MKIAPDQTVVVGGNGQSLAKFAPGTVLTNDVIIRTNSFFFEPCYFLGRRVDIAMIGGDPRVAPFVFETLWRCSADYDLRHWSSHDARVIRAGHRRFAPQYLPMRQLNHTLRQRITELCETYGRVPTTGVQATLIAHGLGARRIVLVGIDLYAGAAHRYVYDPGRHYQDLMGGDVGTRGADLRLHNPDLDRAVLEILNAQEDTTVWRGANSPALNNVLDLAPLRDGPVPDQTTREAPKDWAGHVGMYPISLMKFLRRGSAMYRRTFRRTLP